MDSTYKWYDESTHVFNRTPISKFDPSVLNFKTSLFQPLEFQPNFMFDSKTEKENLKPKNHFTSPVFLFIFGFIASQSKQKTNSYLSTNTMRVIIVETWGHEFTIEVGPKETVLEIKRKVEQILGIAAASQTLAVSEWELEDGLDMEDYPIVTEGTKIDLTIKSFKCIEPHLNQSSKIQIIVKSSATQHQLEVFRAETVGSLKEKIHIIDGTPIKRMSLFFSGIELEEDFRKLSEYGICEFSEIALFLKTMNCLKDGPPSRSLSIVVQTSSSLLDSASIPLKMEDSSIVNELRQLLLSSNYLPADDYLFIHKQRTMRENCSLKWHGVEDGDSIYVFKGTVYRSGY